MAEKAGLPQSRISEFETGTKPKKVEHVEALADALDCTLGFITGREYTRVEFYEAVRRMAFDAFAERPDTTDRQRYHCRRVLRLYEGAPLTADAWRVLAEQIDVAVPSDDDRKLRPVNKAG